MPSHVHLIAVPETFEMNIKSQKESQKVPGNLKETSLNKVELDKKRMRRLKLILCQSGPWWQKLFRAFIIIYRPILEILAFI
jgi:hypothetical protein